MISAWRGRLSVALAIVSLAVLLPLAAFLTGVWLMGWQLQSVQSGSMSPSYPVGSLLVVAPLDASRVEIGMPIVFEDPDLRGRLVAHRVVKVAPGSAAAFITQGDANAFPDPFPVPARNVRGYVQWHVTGLGTVLDFLQWPRSFILLVVVPMVLLVTGEIYTRLRRPREVPISPALNDRLVAIQTSDATVRR